LQNPNIFTSQHYRQAATAVLAGIVIRLLIAIPVCLWARQPQSSVLSAHHLILPDYWSQGLVVGGVVLFQP
jgi:hypothetical protein